MPQTVLASTLCVGGQHGAQIGVTSERAGNSPGNNYFAEPTVCFRWGLPHTCGEKPWPPRWLRAKAPAYGCPVSGFESSVGGFESPVGGFECPRLKSTGGNPKLTTSYVYEPCEFTLSEGTFGAHIDSTAAQWGNRTGWVFMNESLEVTFAEYKKDVDQVCRGLLSAGFEKGDSVAIWSPNTYNWVVLYGAMAKAGIVSACVHPAYTAAEFERCLVKVLERSDRRNPPTSSAERQGAVLPKRTGRWKAAHAAHRRRENHLGHRTATLNDRWLKPGTSRVRSSDAEAKDDY
ncbi:medium-chain acyl-CoA ligase ACSF2, mitochondrial [Ixodes scapularis]